MIGFARRYSDDLVKVVLTNNYRSTQPILDISKTLIDQNQERLINQIEGLSKTLSSENETRKNISDQPIINEYETMRQEMIGICLSVQDLLNQGVLPGHIGIIYKENKYGESLTQFLKQRKIAVYSKRNLNILEIPLAKKSFSF